jgi:DNA-binding response OmpR family regulator
MTGPKILYAEDDPTLRFITKENLERKGYQVVDCKDGKSGLECFKEKQPDICILDVMMPEIDGFTLARKIRENNQDVPILFVTAKSMKEDRIEGLMLGADDYIVKPFSVEELILKIEIFLRRSKKISSPSSSGILELGKLKIDVDNLILKGQDGDVILTQREADLLAYFSRNRNRLLSRETILESLWGENDYFMGRSLDVFISKLRKYIKSDPGLSIENRHGIGFILKTKTN